MKYSRCIIYSSIFIVSVMSCAHAGFIERVSVSSSGVQANSPSGDTSINADGRFIVFRTNANNLVEGDINNQPDIFIHDRSQGSTELISVSSAGDRSNGTSFDTSVSGDGRFVAFGSTATNLTSINTVGQEEIFLHDRSTGTTELVSISSTGEEANDFSYYPSLSTDGRYVSFESIASNIVVNDINDTVDVFVYDRETGHNELVSVSSTGEQGNDASLSSSLNANGRIVSFSSMANNLVAGDSNRSRDIFVHDLDSGLTERISVSSSGAQANNSSTANSISANGRFVAFESTASNLVEGDSNGFHDIFVHDRSTGITERVSLNSSGEQGNNWSVDPAISADGRYVTFNSSASNLVENDFNSEWDVFVHDRNTGETARVSVSSNGEEGDNASGGILISPSPVSADGRFVAFDSESANLVQNDTNNNQDIFLAQNPLSLFNNDLSVVLRPTSGAAQVGEYIRFRAVMKNSGSQTLTNCNAQLVNPLINFQRKFSFYSWPLNVNNPVLNGTIDIGPGEVGQIILAVLPRVAMRREVSFEYRCDTTAALSVPFINTAHLTAKNEPLTAEDFIQLENGNNTSELAIDRANGKYWTLKTIKVSNPGGEPASVNLTTVTDIATDVLLQPKLCEPVDPANSDWSCSFPRDVQMQLDLAAGETKRVLLFVHAWQAIKEQPIKNRIFVEARDQAGEIVAKSSLGVYTLN